MKSIALIVMDMDGTLLAPSPVGISAHTRDTLLKAAKQGTHLAICSGRLPDDASLFVHESGLPMSVLALNGACMLSEPLGEVKYSEHINERDALLLYPLLLGSDTTFAMFCDHDLYICDSDPWHPTPDLVWGTHLQHPLSRTHVLRDPEDATPWLFRGVSKYVAVHEEPDELSRLQETVSQLFPHVDVTSSWSDNIEIIPKGCDKGYGLKRLCETLHIPLSQVMAIGDQDNDLSMLRVAGFPVAMGNATDEVKHLAKFITKDNAHDGVAYAIEKFVLGEEEAL